MAKKPESTLHPPQARSRKLQRTLRSLASHRKKVTSHHNHGHSDDKLDNYRANHPGFPGNREHKKAQ